MAPEHDARTRAFYDHESDEPAPARRRRAAADWGVNEDIFDRMPSRRFKRTDRRAEHHDEPAARFERRTSGPAVAARGGVGRRRAALRRLVRRARAPPGRPAPRRLGRARPSRAARRSGRTTSRAATTARAPASGRPRRDDDARRPSGPTAAPRRPRPPPSGRRRAPRRARAARRAPPRAAADRRAPSRRVVDRGRRGQRRDRGQAPDPVVAGARARREPDDRARALRARGHRRGDRRARRPGARR